MLKIQSKDGRTKLILRDEDEEPINIDQVVLVATTESTEPISETEKEDKCP